MFTTHTPVPAGHDAFPFHMVETHLAGCWGSLGELREDFLALGRHDNGSGTLFNMTALAIRSTGSTNSVSAVHREVTDRMWKPLWEEAPGVLKPVTSVTNGTPLPTWLGAELARLLDHYAPEWRERHDEPALWDAILDVPDAEVWEVRKTLRAALFAFIRERMRLRWTGERVSTPRVVSGGTLLDPNALTLGFARRFTGYKRPDLSFRDPERLAAILNATRTPVQVVFAGKAHPADESGKHALQGIIRRASDPLFGGRIAFIDDYDLHVAHYFVQGCDVWLNNPRRPLEASGTSGMKASAKLPKGRAEPGLIQHTVGWPMDAATYGGSFLYHLDQDRVYVGFVVGLDYADPRFQPFEAFQQFKNHPTLKALLDGGEILAYGARTIVEGGWQSMPTLEMPGAVLVGDAAGTLDGPKIKGVHMAIRCGMAAAEHLAARGLAAEGFDAAWRATRWAKALRKVRNIRPGFRWGLWLGLLNAAWDPEFPVLLPEEEAPAQEGE